MVNMFPVHGKDKAVKICRAFAEGAPKGAKAAVFYGVNATNVNEWQQVKSSGHDWYWIDNSYFDCVRGQQYRVTRNRVQVDPRSRETDGKRFDALGLTVKPWVPAGPHVLAIEQSPSFMRHVANDIHWLDREVKGMTGLRIRVRPWAPNKIEQATSLQRDLEDTDMLVTHSSAAAVEASLRGIACIVSRHSALWGMLDGDDERRQTFGVLADNQWTLDEIREGKAWHYLART